MSKILEAPSISYDLDSLGWVEHLCLTQAEALEQYAPSMDWAFGQAQHVVDTGVIETAETDPYRNGEDYVATWEEAFLFQGYSNGKMSFLTSSVMFQIDRHGFISTATFHWPEKKNPSLGNNEIIVRLQYQDQECIPEKDKFGQDVIIGFTNPRYYLPDVVVKILDEEFGQT